eukprot:15366238-Alexandrium_andersonii.AAC.1
MGQHRVAGGAAVYADLVYLQGLRGSADPQDTAGICRLPHTTPYYPVLPHTTPYYPVLPRTTPYCPVLPRIA